VAPACDEDLLSSSAGSVLLVSEARTGVTNAIGAANNNRPASKLITGLARSEAKAVTDRAILRRITAGSLIGEIGVVRHVEEVYRRYLGRATPFSEVLG